MNDGNAFTLPINTTNIISGLGKCTKRGSKKCFKCDKFNGTKSLTCKSCGVVLRTAPEEKCKVNLDAVQLNTGTLRQVYSVRVRDGGPDQRGFVQLPFRGEKNGSIALSEVALCFVDSCQRLFDDSILKCHEETINSDNLFCQHIKEASKSQKMATDINIKHSTLHSLKVTDEIRMKLYVLATEKEGPLVQRVSKHVLAVKCQVSPKHPLGYLHFCFLNLKGRDVYDKYYCSCAEFKFSSNISHKCIHYFACIWAFASNEKYVEEFNTFLNHEFPVTSKSSDIIVKEISKTLPTTQSLKPKLKRKRKNKNDNKDVKKSQLLMPKIFPVHIKILNGENDGNKSVSWEYNDWLTYVTESINNSMQFENCGLLNTQVFHIPEEFYLFFKSKIPQIYLENKISGIKNEELFHIMNILHVKEIFDTPTIKLRLSKKFVHNRLTGFIEDEKNESSSDTSFIFFMNVGQSTIDESDNTNNSFFIGWLPNVTSVTKVGQLKLQYKYGRKSTCVLSE